MSEIIKEVTGRTGELIVKYEQDINPILEQNKREQSVSQTGDSRKIASLPETVLMQWGREDFNDPLMYMNKWSEQEVQLKLFRRLNSPEFKNLRVWQGQLGAEDITK